MEIEIIQCCVVNCETREVGTVADYGDTTNATLLNMGRAVEYNEEEYKARAKARAKKAVKAKSKAKAKASADAQLLAEVEEELASEEAGEGGGD